MTDSRLRELERRWRESGRVEDEAAYLLERVRVGDLTQERLELAARCGHEAASCAVGAPVASLGDLSPEEFLRRVTNLGGLPAVVVAFVAATRVDLPRFTGLYPDDSRPGAAFALAEAWGLGRTEATGEALEAAAQQAHGAMRTAVRDLNFEAAAVARSAREAARLACKRLPLPAQTLTSVVAALSFYSVRSAVPVLRSWAISN